jgi:hypothetical protein
MRPIKVTQAAAGASPWIPLDYLQRPFNVALAVSLSEDASGITYTVEYTPDNPNPGRKESNPVVSLSRTTTVATLTLANNHGLVTGDSVTVYGSGDANLDGTYAVASTPTTKSLTYTVANTGATAGANSTQAVLMKVFPHDFMAALTARADGNLAFPVMAVRLNNTAYTGGSSTLNILQGYARG